MTSSFKSHASYFNPPSTSRTPSKSPTRARSHNDLLSLARKGEEREAGNQVAVNDFNSRSSLPATNTNGGVTTRDADNLESQPSSKRQDQLSAPLPQVPGGLASGSTPRDMTTQDRFTDRRLSPWAHLDDLFEKLLFSVVSDDGNRLLPITLRLLTLSSPQIWHMYRISCSPTGDSRPLEVCC